MLTSDKHDLLILGLSRLGSSIEAYGDIAKANGADWKTVRRPINRHLGELVTVAVKRGWPMLSAIVVNHQNLQTGVLDGTARDGFLAPARESGLKVDDPEAFVKSQQQALFSWAPSALGEFDPDPASAKEGKAAGGPKFVQ